MTARTGLALAALVFGMSGAARAGDCPGNGRAIGDGTLPLGAAGADFGAIPEACLGDEAFVRARGTVLVAASAPDFYGNIAAAGGVRLRTEIAPRWQLSAAADLATYRYIKNAVVASSGVGAGPPTLGVARALAASDATAAALFLRVLLPIDTAREQSTVFGGELGTALGIAGPRPGLGVQGGASLGVPVTMVGGQSHVALRASAVAEAWASGPWWGGTLGGFGRFQLAPADEGNSSLGVRASGRRVIGRRFWLAMVAEAPLAGADRTNLIVAFVLGLRSGMASGAAQP